jgi:hypothetical protein
MRRPRRPTTAGSSPSRSKSLSKDARCGRTPFNQTVTDMSDQLGLVDQKLGAATDNEVAGPQASKVSGPQRLARPRQNKIAPRD